MQKTYFLGRTNVRMTNTSGFPGRGRGDSGVPASVPERRHRKRSALIYNIVYCRPRRRRRISGRKETPGGFRYFSWLLQKYGRREIPGGAERRWKRCFFGLETEFVNKVAKDAKIVANATKWPSFRGYNAIFRHFGLSARYGMLSICEFMQNDEKPKNIWHPMVDTVK